LLDQKVTKNQVFKKIGCVSMPEVSSRNTRHERVEQIKTFVVAVYCYAHAIRTYLRQEPLSYFSKDSPSFESITS
jgi:hypothetical protein